MNYGQLKDNWRTWSKRKDLSDALLDTIQELVTDRLGRDLRAAANTNNVTLDIPVDGLELDATIKEITDAQDSGGNVYDYVAPHLYYDKDRYCYTIIGNRIYAGGGASLLCAVFERPDYLVNDADENAVLTEWSNLYLYAGLTEIYRYTQENETRQHFDAQYLHELKQTNKQAERKRIGTAPVMGG